MNPVRLLRHIMFLAALVMVTTTLLFVMRGHTQLPDVSYDMRIDASGRGSNSASYSTANQALYADHQAHSEVAGLAGFNRLPLPTSREIGLVEQASAQHAATPGSLHISASTSGAHASQSSHGDPQPIDLATSHHNTGHSTTGGGHSSNQYSGHIATVADHTQESAWEAAAANAVDGADFSTLELNAGCQFSNLDGGVWKQGWPVTYNNDEFVGGGEAAQATKKLRVFVVPHSHTDPGWRVSYTEYYRTQTADLLNTMTALLSRDKARRFIYPEVSFLALWWEDQNDATRETFRNLVSNGQFEIPTGGWVMNDEAVCTLYPIIHQLHEGHTWVARHLGRSALPRTSWANDPFGLSSIMPRMLGLAGVRALVVQRVHYEMKKMLAQQRALEFRWRQPWDAMGRSDFLTHVLPFFSYDIPHTCGPEPAVCCQFDFERTHCPWGINARDLTSMDDASATTHATKLLDQYRKKATLFRTHTLLVPLGDDFRLLTEHSALRQLSNYERAFTLLNRDPSFNVELRWGTLADYFAALAGHVDAPPSFNWTHGYESLFPPPGTSTQGSRFLPAGGVGGSGGSAASSHGKDGASSGSGSYFSLRGAIVRAGEGAGFLPSSSSSSMTSSDVSGEGAWGPSAASASSTGGGGASFLPGSPKAPLPSLAGDFFTYDDVNRDYWSGYYASRSFYKGAGALLAAALRAAEVLHSFVRARVGERATPEGWAARLETARKDLALFQHHDAITGTSRAPVVIDYGKRVERSFAAAHAVASAASALLLPAGSLQPHITRVRPGTFQGSFNFRHEDALVDVSQGPRSILLSNALAHPRSELVRVIVNAARVEVTEGGVAEGGGRSVPSQLAPVWVDKAPGGWSSDTFALWFRAEVPAMGVTAYTLRPLQEGESSASPSVAASITVHTQGQGPPPKSRGPFHSTAAPASRAGEETILEGTWHRLFLSSATGTMTRVELKQPGGGASANDPSSSSAGGSFASSSSQAFASAGSSSSSSHGPGEGHGDPGQPTRLVEDYLVYSGSKSGAYLFLPESPPGSVLQGGHLAASFAVSRGPLVTESRLWVSSGSFPDPTVVLGRTLRLFVDTSAMPTSTSSSFGGAGDRAGSQAGGGRDEAPLLQAAGIHVVHHVDVTSLGRVYRNPGRVGGGSTELVVRYDTGIRNVFQKVPPGGVPSSSLFSSSSSSNSVRGRMTAAGGGGSGGGGADGSVRPRQAGVTDAKRWEQVEAVAYTDQNGLHLMRREAMAKIPLQGNFYPITTGVFLQVGI
eukprot:jgi/Mesvir1/8738/Mv02661-RA.2